MRQEIPNTATNMFARRAMWESAIVSYGRMGASDNRKVDFQTFVTDVGGIEGVQLHSELMTWRHDHVAHRSGTQFEETVVAAYFADSDVNHLSVNVSTDVGPADDSDFAERFRSHVKRLRDHLWESYMAPWGATLAERCQKAPAPTESTPQAPIPAQRIGFAVTLWDRVNGTGTLRGEQGDKSRDPGLVAAGH